MLQVRNPITPRTLIVIVPILGIVVEKISHILYGCITCQLKTNKQQTNLCPIGKGRREGGTSGRQKDSGIESGMGGVTREHGGGQKQGS